MAAAAATTATTIGSCSRAPEGDRPIASVATRWDVDPWARGSYSALPVGTPLEVRSALARTVVGGRVVLAGEYTATDYPATVHGAYLSGRRAAAALARLLPVGASVAVVGAGIAGLSAARTLTEAGFAVQVREARNRIGGRVHTDYSLGVPLELGASWIHGVTGNPLVPLAREAGLTLAPTDFEDAEARRYPDGSIATGMGRAERSLWRAAGVLGSRRSPAGQSVERGLADLGWRADSPERELAATAELVMDYGVDLDRLGAQALWEGKLYRGGDSLVVGGYGKIAELLAQDLPIQLSAPVDSVTLRDERVLLAGNGDREVFAGAVIAVPLPLLQSGSPRVALPPHTREALSGLITGNLEKVFLQYERVWWPDVQVLQIVSAPEQRWSEWYNLARVTDRPFIFGFSGGSAALGRPAADSSLATEATDILQQAY